MRTMRADMDVISSFYGAGVHTQLSNFYPWEMPVDGLLWPTVEHYFQAMKTTDASLRETIRFAGSPSQAKKLGRHLPLRSDWEAIKIPVMRRALMHKFEANNEMGEYLLSTGNALLIEGNTWGDRFWGAVDNQGENWLGGLLMMRRAELRALTS